MFNPCILSAITAFGDEYQTGKRFFCIFQLNFATCLEPGAVKTATLRTTSTVEQPLLSNQKVLTFVVFLASTPRENRLPFPFDGSDGNILFICMWHRKARNKSSAKRGSITALRWNGTAKNLLHACTRRRSSE